MTLPAALAILATFTALSLAFGAAIAANFQRKRGEIDHYGIVEVGPEFYGDLPNIPRPVDAPSGIDNSAPVRAGLHGGRGFSGDASLHGRPDRTGGGAP